MVCCERPLVSSCWCCGLRGGCISAGTYALIYSAFSIAFQSWTISNKNDYPEGDQEVLQKNRVFFVTTCLDIALYLFLFVGSIMVLLGTTNLNRYNFILFLITMGLLVIFQGVGCVLYVVILLQTPNSYVMVLMMIAVLFLVIDLMCEVCVFSFYQELRRDAPTQVRAIYQSQIPPQGPLADKNTEVTEFTSITGSPGPDNTQAFGLPQGSLTTFRENTQSTSGTKLSDNDNPPPYVA